MNNDLICKHCGEELQCLGGCSAHPDNWYCSKCSKEASIVAKAIDKGIAQSKYMELKNLEKENTELKSLIMLIYNDLLMRAVIEADAGIDVANVSDFIWGKIKKVVRGENDSQKK